MASLVRMFRGTTDATPRTVTKPAPGRIPSMNREHVEAGGINDYDGSSRSNNSGRDSRRSTRISASTEQPCSCPERLNKPLIQDEMQKIYAAQEVSQPKPRLTQAERDRILFCSAEFGRYLEKQDKGITDYAQWLSNQAIGWKTQAQKYAQEINDLRTELGKAKSASDALQHELDSVKNSVQQMQKEAMNNVDRFQPTTDGEVAQCVKVLAAKVQTAIKHIVKSPCQISDEQWLLAAEDLVYPGSFAGGYQPAEVDVRTLKKLTLQNIIWHFLTLNIFQKAFGGFEGEEPDPVDEMYKFLFPQQGHGFESESWRSLTASQLQKRPDDSVKAERILIIFQEVVLRELGYKEKDESLILKVATVIAVAMDFWKLTAQQRAVFAFEWCDCTAVPLLKAEHDKRYTTVEAGDDDSEKSGQIWFVTRPGLTKRGTGAGKDYHRRIMFEDFKVHVMVVEERKPLPKDGSETEETRSETGEHEHLVLNGGAEDHLDASAIPPPAEPVGDDLEKVDDTTMDSDESVTIVEHVIDDTSCRRISSSEATRIDEHEGQEFMDTSDTVDKMLTAMPQIPEDTGATGQTTSPGARHS